MKSQNISRFKPWTWVPSLYFAEGLPYVAVMTIAVILYKNLQLSNTEIAFYTSWLYLPWVIKPIWSPFVDVIKTKRLWIIAMQVLIGAAFAGIAFFLPTSFGIQLSLAIFWLLAFASATHDIAADGFYMLGLNQGDQSLFVGIRNTFYRLAMIFGQGVLVMLAGLLAEGKVFPSLKENYALAWSLVFYLLAALFIGLAIYHSFVLPKPELELNRNASLKSFTQELKSTIVTFFQKKDIVLMFAFILCYRLGESQLVKIASPFLLDSIEKGGLGISTTHVGMIYGTFGVIALLLGGVLGGILVAQHGLKRWILWMAVLINLPDLAYFFLALYQPGVVITTIAVICEQFGYGFGFTAFMMYLIYVADGPHKTAHYALGTGLMALGMMLPGMVAGWINDSIGYPLFFVWVCVCTLPGIYLAYKVKQRLPDGFGKKES